MKEEAFRREFEKLTPDVPESFHQSVETFLTQKVNQEVYMKATSKTEKRPMLFSGRRSLVFALVAVLLLGTVAIAATHWGIFDVLSYMLGTQPPMADTVMQANLHQETVNGVEITIKEAGYDGRTLFLQYSYRIPDATEPLGETMPETGSLRWLDSEDYQPLDDRNVGWWIDHFWVNGQCMDMAANSGSEDHGSEVPGEIVRTEYWRLDNIDVALDGKVEIAMPIGERQPLEEYSFKNHPEKYDADRNLMKPEKGLVTFTFDTKDTLDRVITFAPEQETVTPDVTLKVKEAAFTPLMTYITLEMQPNTESVAAYKAEHGEGFYSEDGTLLWEYTGADVYGGWVSSLQLVDGNGTVLFPDHWGNNGYNAEWAEFTYPYMDAQNLPEELWLAPVEDGAADMTRAVRIK